MKLTIRLGLILAALLASVTTSHAQTYPRSTTLSAAITARAAIVVLASGTGVEQNGALWIDSEFIPILSCVPNTSCAQVNVMRTQKPQAHGSAAVVTVVSAAARPNIMLATSAAWRVGQCSTSTAYAPNVALAGYQFLPIYDIDQGYVYMCRRNGTGGTWVWNATNAQNINGTVGSVWTAWP